MLLVSAVYDLTKNYSRGTHAYLQIAAFAVSALASNWERLGKPFNPLLGETYEYQNSEFRIICEQVNYFITSRITHD